MRTMKALVGVIGALVPILYCGGLLYYFLGFAGSWEEVETNGLGPALLGLGIFILFFTILLAVKIVRVFSGPRSSGSGGGGGAGDAQDGERAFDADAVVARYLAQRQAEVASALPAAPPPARNGGGPPKRPSFGRKNR